jgi:hypothetical protein
MSPLATLTAVAAIGLATILMADSREDPPPAELTVIYIGADDCAPCLAWRRAHRQQFLASAEFARLGYREIIAATVRDLREDEHWPESLRGFRGEFDRLPGAPTWLVVGDNRILASARGLREWEEIAIPKLRLLAR